MNLATYEDWKHCINDLCGIPLTPEYVEKRISELNDRENYHTKSFIKSWGESHLERTIGWFERAKQELNG